jgi:hypothetical protein
MDHLPLLQVAPGDQVVAPVEQVPELMQVVLLQVVKVMQVELTFHRVEQDLPAGVVEQVQLARQQCLILLATVALDYLILLPVVLFIMLVVAEAASLAEQAALLELVAPAGGSLVKVVMLTALLAHLIQVVEPVGAVLILLTTVVQVDRA